MEENYMDKFNSPEEFIKQQIINNKDCILTKKDMKKMLREKNISFNVPVEYIKKSELFEMLINKYSYKELSKYVGVRNTAFMQKFNITNEELLFLSKCKFIKVSYEKLRLYTPNNSWSKYKLYSVYDYFTLTQNDIDKKLKR